MTIPAIEKTVSVPLTRDDAFRVFTADIALWWPGQSHSLSARTGAQPRDISMDPHVGGKIRETLSDGSFADWATITDWRQGEGFAFDWYVGRDPADATQVSVQFIDDGAQTIVTLRHDGFDRLGTAGAEMAANYNTGWDKVLGASYYAACMKQAA